MTARRLEPIPGATDLAVLTALSGGIQGAIGNVTALL
jgi:hypothetical protein